MELKTWQDAERETVKDRNRRAFYVLDSIEWSSIEGPDGIEEDANSMCVAIEKAKRILRGEE